MLLLEIHRGTNLALGPTPDQRSEDAPAAVALLGADYPGIRPRLAVAEGDVVRRGDVLFSDRTDAALRFTAPAAGRVRAVHVGRRRALESVVIDVDAGRPDPAVLDRTPHSPAGIREALQTSGLWPALRSRPYDRIPRPAETAAELFVVAIDTNPLAPDPLSIIRARAEEFHEGLSRLSTLVDACYVCADSDADLACPDAPGIVPVQVRGPHPAGLAGTLIYGVTDQRTKRPPSAPVWYVGYQDVIAIGALFLSGRLDSARTVTVAGPGLAGGRLVTTLLGASLAGLSGAVSAGSRVVSGPLLSGREAGSTTAYLGRYHQQVVVLAPASQDQPGNSGMLTLEALENIWPLRLPVLPLLKALLVEDTETLVALGATHLAPEDLALCAYLCPARLDYGGALERTLDALRRGD